MCYLMSWTKIVFSDEIHFLLDRYMNKQRCIFWGFANLQQFHEKRLHPVKVTAVLIPTNFGFNKTKQQLTHLSLLTESYNFSHLKRQLTPKILRFRASEVFIWKQSLR